MIEIVELDTGSSQHHEFGINDISHVEEELKLSDQFSMS